MDPEIVTGKIVLWPVWMKQRINYFFFVNNLLVGHWLLKWKQCMKQISYCGIQQEHIYFPSNHLNVKTLYLRAYNSFSSNPESNLNPPLCLSPKNTGAQEIKN